MENSTMLRCVKCNCELQQDAVFCPECGTKVEVEAAPTNTVTSNESQGHKFCNKCGMKNDINAQACTSCGNIFSTAEGDKDKAQNPLSSLQNIKMPSEIKIPSEIKVPKNVKFNKPFLIAVPVLLVVVLIGFVAYNSFVAKRLDYVLLNTQKQLSNESTDAYESFDLYQNLKTLLTDSYDMTIDVDSDVLNVEMEKNKNNYSYTIYPEDSDEKVVFEYTLSGNTLSGSIKLPDDALDATFDLKYNSSDDELEVFVTADEEYTGYGEATIIVEAPALKIIDGKIIQTDEFAAIKKEYTDSLVELILDSEVENEKSKSSEFDREITLEIDGDEYNDLLFDYYEACVDVVLQNIKNVSVTTSDEYADEIVEGIIEELEYGVESVLEELEYSISIPEDNFEIILKTENSRVKGIETDDFELVFENTKSYLNNTVTLEVDGAKGVAEIAFDKKALTANVQLKDGGSKYKMNFNYDLKSGKGEMSTDYDGYKDKYKFILFADKKSAEIGYSNDYSEMRIEINAR